MGMSSDEIVVGITGNSTGLQAATTEGVASLTELQAALLKLADASKLISAQLTMSGGSFAATGAQTAAYAEQVTAAHEAQTAMAEEMSRAGGITGAMEGLGTTVVGAAGNFKMLLETMAGLWAIQEVVSLFDQLAGSAENAAKQIFQLNVNTERFEFMWQYQYARQGKPDPDMARQIAAWSYQFSYQAPFTRQDIMAGIGGLAPTGLNLQGLQRFAPLIADLASTHTSVFSGGGSQLTFSQVALAVMEAMTTGNARRMLMELQIQPRQLEKYGVRFAGQGHLGGQILNPWQFLPALEQLSKDKGWAGAAQAAAHQTFWGEYSSFIDRLQNLGLNIGGMNPDASVRPGSMFANIKKDMEDISSWIDAHQSQLQKLADMIGDKGIGGALKLAREMATGFLSGLEQSGLGKDILQDFMKAGQWMADPSHQQELKQFGEMLGRDTGANLKDIAQGMGDIASSMSDLKKALGPDGTKLITDGLSHIGDVVKVVERGFASTLALASDLIEAFKMLKDGDVSGAAKLNQKFAHDLTSFFTGGFVDWTPPGADQGQGQHAASQGFVYLRNQQTGQVIAAPPGTDLGKQWKPYTPTTSGMGAQQSKLAQPVPGMEWVVDPQGHYLLMSAVAANQMMLTYRAVNPSTGKPYQAPAHGSLKANLQNRAQMEAAWNSGVSSSGVAADGGVLAQQAHQQGILAANTYHDAIASQGFQSWGADAVKLFIAGMKSQAAPLATASANIAEVVKQYLHFSKPDVGPLADADKWMPDFIDLLVSGLKAGVPRVRQASTELGNAMAIGGGQPGTAGLPGAVHIGGGSTTVVFNGVPGPYMERKVKEMTRQQQRQGAALAKVASFRVFGTLGV